jgi:hypothetical protein
MQAAPLDAVFIWCNSRLDYPQALARKLGRTDLKIVSPSWLELGWRGRELSGIVRDHASDWNDEQWRRFHFALAMVRQ